MEQNLNNPYPNQQQPPNTSPPADGQVPPPAETPAQTTPIKIQTKPEGTVPSISQNQAVDTISIASQETQETLVTSVNYVGYALYFFAIILLVLFIKKLLEIWKKSKKLPLPAEDDGTVCKTCGGSGKVKEKVTKSAPCGHCKQTGIDICHHCGGSGRNGMGLTVPQTEEEVQSLIKCDYCGGTGSPNPPVACCMCKGKRKESYEETIEVPCPDCKGTGRK